jgi:hypothetical protein
MSESGGFKFDYPQAIVARACILQENHVTYNLQSRVKKSQPYL